MRRPATVAVAAHASISGRRRCRLTVSGAGPMPCRVIGRPTERGGERADRAAAHRAAGAGTEDVAAHRHAAVDDAGGLA